MKFNKTIKDEDIKVIFFGNNYWTQDELEELKVIFGEFGNISYEERSPRSGLELPIIIKLGGTILFTSFLVKFGATFGKRLADDSYSFLKAKFMDLFLKERERGLDEGVETYIDLRSYDEESNTHFFYFCYYSDAEHIENFLYSCYILNSLIHKAIKSNYNPFNTKCTNFSVFVDFKYDTDDLDIKITISKEIGNTLIYNKIFRTSTKIQYLENINWNDIEWETEINR